MYLRNLGFIVCMLSLAPFSLASDWTLSSENSSVSFYTVKKGSIGEVHDFKTVKGEINNSQARIDIETASVESSIPIRNDRLRDILFQSDMFPDINIVAEFDSAILQSDSRVAQHILGAELTLKGASKPIQLDITISRIGNDALVVSSRQPVLVKASDFGLEKPITALSNLVGGIDIATNVPVFFTLYFTQSK